MEDFERLMDLTTPYYKARFKDLAEQAQMVMHALAVRRLGGDGLCFGHTAAEIGAHAGLATNTVSAQLDVLEREGLVEKNAAHGRTQYRIAEQLFRLWLQMRATRRIRQSVTGLSEFLEAMFDLDELKACLSRKWGAGPLAAARLSFAVAGAMRRSGRLAPAAEALDQAFQVGESARAWFELGALLDADKGDAAEAEVAYRRAIEFDPATEVADSACMNLGKLLGQQNRSDEASEVYAQASERNTPLRSFFQRRAVRRKHHALVESAQRASRANDPTALREALRRLRAESADLAVMLVDEAFVGGVLAPALTQGTAARALLELLRELGFEPSARPLLLAFEAAITNRPQSLDDLEPEIQGAAKRMFQRLTGDEKPPAELGIG